MVPSRGNHKKGLKDNYGRLIDFRSQISKLSYFNWHDLADILMHHRFPVSFFDVAILDVRKTSRTPVLAICASLDEADKSKRLRQARICSVHPVVVHITAT